MTQQVEWTPKARAVLAAASELFYERGIHAVGVEAVAERAGVTKKTLYDRFGSKERLVVEYLRDRDHQWRALLELRWAEGGTAPEARLRGFYETSAEWSRTRGWKGCSMINAHAEISDPAHPAYEVIVAQKRWTLALLAELVHAAGGRGAAADEAAAELMLVHEGTLAGAGVGVPADAFERGRDLSLRLLGEVSRAAPAAR